MFESFFAVPLHFTVEFLGFLVTGGGALLVLSRPELVPGNRSNRIAASLGFGALAAAQVAHGGAFVKLDGDQLLIALHTLGLALLLVGIVGGLRTDVPAVGAFMVKEGGAFLPAAAAFFLAFMAFAGSLRSGPKAFRRLSAAALLLGVAEALTAFAPDAQFGVGRVNNYSYAAHTAKAVGFLWLTGWLWTGVKTSIRTRFVASFGALLLGVVLFLSTALSGVISNNIEDEELRRVGAQLTTATQSLLDRDVRELSSDAQTIGSLPAVQEDLADRADLFARGDSLLAITLDADFVMFLDQRGRRLATAGSGPVVQSDGELVNESLTSKKGQKRLVRIGGSEVIDDVVSSPSTPLAAGAVKVGDWALLLAATEVHLPEQDKRRVGVVAIGRFIDARTVDLLASNFDPARPSLLVGNKVVASAIDGVAESDQILLPESDRDLEQGLTSRFVGNIGGRTFYSAAAQLTTAQRFPLDITLVISSPSRIVTETRRGVTTILFLVAMGIGAIALFLAWLSGQRITSPIQQLTRTARSVREGDLTARAKVGGVDEVGQLGETFNEMTASLLRMTDDLRGAARQERDLRGRIETIIQSMADGLVAVDSERNILAFNREAENLTGIKAKTAIGKSIDKILRATDGQGEPLPLPIHDLAEGSAAGVMLERRTGDPIPIAITTAVLRDDEGISGAVAVLRDLTRERELERMKSEFLSNISHELRTPLTPIKGYAEILGRKNVPPAKAKQFVAGILESTERLERIVGLLVDFSALEAGRLSPRAAPIDIGALVTKLGKEWTERAKGHEVVLDVKSRLPKVFGDERLIRRSLEEVIDNAVKFSPSGGVIRLEARSTAAGNGKGAGRAVSVTIADEGIGIAPEDLPKIFSDFHQLDGSETRTYGGLGLGLAFVHRIVEAHSGAVDVDSKPDKGTRFTIKIPAARTTTTEAGTSKSGPTKKASVRGAGRKRASKKPTTRRVAPKKPRN